MPPFNGGDIVCLSRAAMRPFATMVLTIGLAACGTYTEYQRDRLSDNAIDSALKDKDVSESSWPGVVYYRVLDRLPPTADGRALRAYLESIGAKCLTEDNEVSCTYRTWMMTRTDRYLLSSRVSEGKFVRTDYIVTFNAPVATTVSGHLSVKVESR
jgi:hypothetical protein